MMNTRTNSPCLHVALILSLCCGNLIACGDDSDGNNKSTTNKTSATNTGTSSSTNSATNTSKFTGSVANTNTSTTSTTSTGNATNTGTSTNLNVANCQATYMPIGRERIGSIERPAYTNSTEVFSYTYSYRPPAQQDLPTIIFMPGGPGGDSISSPAEWADVIPEEFGLILTDPRGTKCNDVKLDPVRAFTTPQVAADIVAVVKELGLKNYVLYGHSYGTVVATHVAQQSEEAGVPATAVILEGILGRAFQTEEEVFSGFDGTWQTALTLLPADVSNYVRGQNPLGLEPHVWGGAIYMASLFNGGALNDKAELFQALKALSGEGVDENNPAGEAKRESARTLIKMLDMQYDMVRQNDSVVDIEFYKQVACREIYTVDTIEPGLFAGKIRGVPNAMFDVCQGVTGSVPFDAASFSYQTPTYYFIGSEDAQTPPWQGNYHFQSVNDSFGTKVVVEGAGHSPITSDLKMSPGCAQKVIGTVALDPDALGDVLEFDCTAPFQIEFSDEL